MRRKETAPKERKRIFTLSAGIEEASFCLVFSVPSVALRFNLRLTIFYMFPGSGILAKISAD